MLRTTYLHSGWEFIQTEREAVRVGTSPVEWLPANVPGHVHLDLVANGVIPDPFRQMNELGCQWVDEADWSYRTVFEWAPSPELPRRVLRFEGLDTVCKVVLNGEVVAESDNMFVPLEVDVTERLKEGENTLRIDFQSAVRVGYARRAEYFAKEGIADDVMNFPERSFVRKAQYMSGWDWGPRLVSCGIWQPVKLIEYAARILDVYARPEPQEDGTVKLYVEAEVDGEGSVVHILGDHAHEGLRVEIDATADDAWNNGQFSFASLTSVLTAADWDDLDDDAIQDSKTTTVSLSRIRLLQEPDQWGQSFEFEVDGRRIWARGANWIPDSSFPATVSRQRYREQLERAVDMGFNMLRVWGGGLYETDDFYELCDELGILVWQDFPFGCAYYPDDEAMQAVIAKEAEVNVKRLRNHPCLALWCGNNENLQMFQQAWGGKEKNPSRYYGENLYDRTLPETLAKFDPGRSYIASSPIGESDKPQSQGGWSGANAGEVGDQHNWDVWHGRGDWRYYSESTGRFSSEYGFASSCSLATWRETAGLRPEQIADWSSHMPVIRWHDKTAKGWDTFMSYVKLHYPDPQSLEDWVYYSQLNQRDALRYGVEHYRRSEFCRGSLIWQLNDCWPVQSWAILDSNGHYKALAYELRRVYADVLLSIRRDNDRIEVWAANDGTEPVESTVFLVASELSTGDVLQEWDADFALEPNERKAVLEVSVAGLAVPDVLLTAEWEGLGAWQLLAEPKAARFAPAEPIVVSTSEDGYLNIQTTTPVVDLMLTEDGSPVPFLDNFLTSAEAGTLQVRVASVPKQIEARSLAGKHPVRITRSPL